MATKNFTQFDLRTPLLTGDYLVGYNQDGSIELRTQVRDVVNLATGVASNLKFPYLPLSGGEVTGDLNVDSGVSVVGLLSTLDNNTAVEWNEAYTTVSDLSSSWNSSYDTVNSLSAGWEATLSSVVDYLSTNDVLLSSISLVDGGTSADWNSVYANVNELSAGWQLNPDPILTVTNYLSTNNVLVSSLDITEQLTVAGSISSTSTIYGNLFIAPSGNEVDGYPGGVGGWIDLRGGDGDNINEVPGSKGGYIKMTGSTSNNAPNGAGYIDTSAVGESEGGNIITRGGGSQGDTGGSINTSGGIGGGAAGGSINLSGGNSGTGGSIIAIGSGDPAGSLNMSGGNGAGGSIDTSNGGGSIDTSGTSDGLGGSINTSDSGGSINTSDSGGSINTSDQGGSITTGPRGGSINTSGYPGFLGGSINTYGDTSASGGSIDTYGVETNPGGSIDTSGGGGSINTRGTGSIELGSTGTRTTLSGIATQNRTIALPNNTGTIALESYVNNFVHLSGDPVIATSLTVNGTISGFNLRTSFNQGSASGDYSFAEGSGRALGNYSHAAGYSTIASGNISHAEGNNTIASGQYSHAEGTATIASGQVSHAEGAVTTASGQYSHAEGASTVASGSHSHAAGYSTIASGIVSHAEGSRTIAKGTTSHAAGFRATAAQNYTYAWSDGNLGTAAANLSSTRTGQYMVSASGGMFVPGNVGIGTDNNSNALTVAGTISGFNLTTSFNLGSATGNYSFAEGSGKAFGTVSHAEGVNTLASGNYSHAEGANTTASGTISHAEGVDTVAFGEASHAEGSTTTANGFASHAEGANSVAGGIYSHAEGRWTKAAGNYSHAAGYFARAQNNNSYAWADGNVGTAIADIQTTRDGQYMVSASGGMFVPGNVGIGTDNNSNALTINGTLSVNGPIVAKSSTIPLSVINVSTNIVFSNTDTNKVFHFDTTSTALTASFPSTLSEGFNIAIVDTGTKYLHLSAGSGLTYKAIGTKLMDQYAGAYVYKTGSDIFAIGGL